jgi:hypothetical protein
MTISPSREIAVHESGHAIPARALQMRAGRITLRQPART